MPLGSVSTSGKRPTRPWTGPSPVGPFSPLSSASSDRPFSPNSDHSSVKALTLNIHREKAVNNLRKDFEQAIINCDYKGVQGLLSQFGGPRPKKKFLREAHDEQGRTILHHAARQGSASIITMLVKAGAELDVCDNNGCTPMHHAVLHNQRAVIEELKNLGANVNACNNNGCTALHQAVKKGKLSSVIALLLAGANINIKDSDNMTALDYAQQRGFSRIAEKVSVIKKKQEKSLLQAARKGRLEKMQELLNWGLDPDAVDPSNAPKWQGKTALGYMVDRLNPDMVEELLIRGAKTDIVHPKTGLTVLGELVKKHEKQLRQAFIDGKPNKVGDIARLLIDAGASIDPVDPNSSSERTRFHKAVQRYRGRQEDVKELCLWKDLGADINIFDSNGSTPLHTAVRRGSKRLVDLLVKWNANLDAQDCEESTPLHYATLGQNTDMMRFLVAAGANPDIQNNAGNSAFGIVENQGYSDEVMQALL